MLEDEQGPADGRILLVPQFFGNEDPLPCDRDFFMDKHFCENRCEEAALYKARYDKRLEELKVQVKQQEIESCQPINMKELQADQHNFEAKVPHNPICFICQAKVHKDQYIDHINDERHKKRLAEEPLKNLYDSIDDLTGELDSKWKSSLKTHKVV